MSYGIDRRIRDTFLPQAHVINTQAELLSMLVNLEEDPAYDNAMERLCQTERAWLNSLYKPSSVRTYLKKYRDAVHHAGLSHGFTSFLGEERSQVIEREETHAANVQRRQEHQYPITPDQAEALVAWAEALLPSAHYPAVAIALCLLTGRRPYEVCVVGAFRPHPSAAMRANQYLLYQGAAKTRDEERASRDLAIPVLIDPTKIVLGHRMLQELHDFRPFHPQYYPTGVTGASQAFMRSCGARFREACTKFFKPIVPDMRKHLGHDVTPQSLRKYYEAMVEAWWQHTGWAPPRFIMEILGHYDLRHADEYLDICFTERVDWRFRAHNLLKGED